MEFRILGPLEVLANGRALDLGGPKQRALLALLLLEANRVVPRDRLIDALWDESPPEPARTPSQVNASQLRKALGRERLETADPGYRLRVDGDELDLARFRSLEAEGRLDEGRARWRGAPAGRTPPSSPSPRPTRPASPSCASPAWRSAPTTSSRPAVTSSW